MSNLGNNVNPYGSVFTTTNGVWIKQYQTFVGATLVQPLLKDGGLTPTFAGLRLSALESENAFQEYRRQLMLTVFRAESAYWSLYYSQEQVRFFDQSVAVAQNVLDDSREKLKAGTGAELNVMEAQSALALRDTKRNDALQNYYEALGNMQILKGVAPLPSMSNAKTPVWHVVDAPRETSPEISYATSFQQAFSMNPDFLIQQNKMRQDGLRLDVARNQLLPALNIKASYGYNGLGLTPDSSWEMAQNQDFPSWSIGLEFSMPLFGNIKARNLYQAARLATDEAYLHFKAKGNINL